MGLIEWNLEQFSVDVEEMDEQHKKWIAIINRLHTSLIDHNSVMSPEQAIREMVAYTKFHFNYEESLMQNAQYPSYGEHLQEHAQFILSLEKLERDIINGTQILKTQIMSILKNWLVDHICKMDKAYGVFLSKSMVE